MQHFFQLILKSQHDLGNVAHRKLHSMKIFWRSLLIIQVSANISFLLKAGRKTLYDLYQMSTLMLQQITACRLLLKITA
jgi:hypothetical protein